MTSPMRRPILDIATFVHIHFFASFPQMTVEVIVVRTNESHIINAVCMPLYWGIARMIQASPITMRSPAMNSMSILFHMPFMAFFISVSLNVSVP